MKHMRKTIILVLAVCLLLGLVACGGSRSGSSAAQTETKSAREQIADIIEQTAMGLNGIQPTPLPDRSHINKGLPGKKNPRDVTVAYAAQSLGSVFFQTYLETLQRETARYGYNLIYQVCDFNIELQTQKVDSFVAQGVDIIIVASNTQAHTSTFRRAAEAGIPVLAGGNQSAERDANLICNFLQNSFKAGYLVGEYVAREIYEQGKTYKVGFILNYLGSADTESRANGFQTGFQYVMRELSGNPYPSQWDAILECYLQWRSFVDRGTYSSPAGKIEFVGLGVGGAPTMEGGQRAANDLVAANLDMDLLYVETDNMWPGVEVVLRQNNLQPGKDLYIACAADSTKFGMEAVMKGDILAIGINSSEINALGWMEVIRTIFEEGQLDRINNLPANHFTNTAVVNIKNVNDFYDPNRNLARPIPLELKTIPEVNAGIGDDSPPF